MSLSLLRGETVTVDVEFKLTELERMDCPLANVPVRLVLGQSADWQDPNAGQRFVTDAKGEAHFTAPGIVDRRWQMVNVAMTGLSVPKRADHIMLAVELEQLVPAAGGGYRHLQWLHTMDIDCFGPSDCATSDITNVYTRAGTGRFSVQGSMEHGLKMPELGGMVLSGPGYKLGGFFLSPADGDASRKRWKLQLTLQRKPAPVLR